MKVYFLISHLIGHRWIHVCCGCARRTLDADTESVKATRRADYLLAVVAVGKTMAIPEGVAEARIAEGLMTEMRFVGLGASLLGWTSLLG